MERTYPINIIQKDKALYQPHFENPTYAPKVVILENVYFLWSKALFSTVSGFIKTSFPWESFYSYSFWDGLKTIISKSLQFQTKRINDQVFFVTNEHSSNYFHWFTEVIPKLLIGQQQYPSVSKVILPHTCTNSFHFETLSYLGLKPIPLKKDKTYLLNQVFHVHGQAKFPGYFHQPTIKHLQNWFHQIHTVSSPVQKKVYISRQHALRRKLNNEQEIKKIVSAKGFEVICSEDLNFKNSLELFSSTSHLVSIHGAGLTNMLFMPKSGIIVEFLHPDVVTNKCYFFLAEALGHKYYYINGVQDKNNQRSHVDSDLEIPPFELENLLNEL